MQVENGSRRVRLPLTEYRVVNAFVRYLFHEESLKQIALDSDIDPSKLRVIFIDWGIRPRNPSQQRILDKKHGRYDHSTALKTAWAQGAYSTERYRSTRREGDWGFCRDAEHNPFYGHRHTEHTRSRLSLQARERCISSFGTYGPEWTPELRERIVRRDAGCCQICCGQSKLQVHHVDHDRRRSTPENLLTVCASCHLAYHGRAELVVEMGIAHIRMLERMGRH